MPRQAPPGKVNFRDLNLLDMLRYMVGPHDCEYQPPHQMSLQQKAAAFHLLMGYYGLSRSTTNRHQNVLVHKRQRELHSSFSSALLDGLVALKESVEDRLVCTIELDLEWVNKPKPGQTNKDLVHAITWRLPLLLRNNLHVEKVFTDMEKGLAKAVVHLINEGAFGRNHGLELLRKHSPFRSSYNNDDDDAEEVETAARPHPRVARTTNDPSAISSVRRSRSSNPDDDEFLWQGMASLNPIDEEEELLPIGYRVYSTGEGNGDDIEAFGEEEEDDGQEWGEDEEEGDEEDVYPDKCGFASPFNDSQPVHVPQPMFVVVPMDNMFPLVFGPPAQAQLVALNRPQAHPICQYSTQHHSQQPQRQSYGMIPNLSPGSREMQASRTREATASAVSQSSQRRPSYPSFNSLTSPSHRQGPSKPSRTDRGALGECGPLR